MQVVSLAFECVIKGVVMHELLHVCGFSHEHSRLDRDEYVKIHWADIKEVYWKNFCKYETANMCVKYDLESLLHYSRSAFAKLKGSTTIEPFAKRVNMGQRIKLSNSDILRVNKFYSCPQYVPSEEDNKDLSVLNDVTSGATSCSEANVNDPASYYSVKGNLRAFNILANAGRNRDFPPTQESNISPIALYSSSQESKLGSTPTKFVSQDSKFVSTGFMELIHSTTDLTKLYNDATLDSSRGTEDPSIQENCRVLNTKKTTDLLPDHSTAFTVIPAVDSSDTNSESNMSTRENTGIPLKFNTTAIFKYNFTGEENGTEDTTMEVLFEAKSSDGITTKSTIGDISITESILQTSIFTPKVTLANVDRVEENTTLQTSASSQSSKTQHTTAEDAWSPKKTDLLPGHSTAFTVPAVDSSATISESNMGTRENTDIPQTLNTTAIFKYNFTGEENGTDPTMEVLFEAKSSDGTTTKSTIGDIIITESMLQTSIFTPKITLANVARVEENTTSASSQSSKMQHTTAEDDQSSSGGDILKVSHDQTNEITKENLLLNIVGKRSLAWQTFGSWSEHHPRQIHGNKLTHSYNNRRKRSSETFKPVCGFEHGFCGWKQSTEDDLDWRLCWGALNVNSGNFRPEGFHLSLKSSPKYVASGQKALLQRPIVQPSNCISFWYSSWKNGIMGTLNVYITSSGGKKTLLWSSGNKDHVKWTKAQIMLSPHLHYNNVHVVVEGITGPSDTSNIAMDNLYVGQCR
ncbi:uncharacterized protein LOC142748240 [Rhinoderma darwinii]|uniref:uncharacterized protein LOC142748240 n=1 Tax=Rhinoderma darwinii TaxID=43563 RepID=UPI003F67293B